MNIENDKTMLRKIKVGILPTIKDNRLWSIVVIDLFRVVKFCLSDEWPEEILSHQDLFIPCSEILGIDNKWENNQPSPWFDISRCFVAVLQLTPGKPYGRRCVAGILHL